MNQALKLLFRQLEHIRCLFDIKLTTISLFLVIATTATSQNTIQKLSKTIEYSYENVTSMVIQAEKATIKITGKPQKTIEMKIILISKHKIQSTALNDLKYIKFEQQKEGSKLLLKNFYESSNRKIESNLSIVYELIVPEEISMQLNNLYGAIELQNLFGSKTLDIAFGRLEMRNIAGNNNLHLKYTNLKAQNFTGQLTGTLSKSDVELTDCNSSIDLIMSYGTLKAAVLNECKLIKINGTRTEVHLQTPSMDYNFDLKTSYSKVEAFDNEPTSYFKSTSKTKMKTITVTTSYCPIKIKLK